MDEARMERTDYGMTATTEGWFAVSVRDAAWMTNEKFGAACVFEGDAVSFSQVGYTLAVLAPGQCNGLYHREEDQEDFLVLSEASHATPEYLAFARGDVHSEIPGR
jgi:hypothetical protein